MGQVLLDPACRDSLHDSDALGWAEYFKQPEVVQLRTDPAANS